MPDLLHAVRPLRAALLLVLAATAVRAQTPQAPAELLEPPRIGLVCRTGAAAAKQRVAPLREWLSTNGYEAEIVLLDALPASASKAKVPVPRWVVVLDEAKSAATGATTEEYDIGKGKTRRIRYRGATAQARGTLYEFRDAPVEIAEVEEVHDASRPPGASFFAEHESKKEIVIEPEDVLDRVLRSAVAQRLALATGIELWNVRAEIPALAAKLSPADAAAFWRRASCVALDDDTALVPWHALETAALDLWKRAPGEAQRRANPEEKCAWCTAPAPVGDAECACPESSALADALRILRKSIVRSGGAPHRTAAQAVKVSFKDLNASRAKPWTQAVAALETRVRAEQKADRETLRARLAQTENVERRKDWYVVLTAREPVEWEPTDPDLLRHAARLVQCFKTDADLVARFFGGIPGRATIGLAHSEGDRTEYSPVDRRDYAGDPSALGALVERAVWGNARGVPKAP